MSALDHQVGGAHYKDLPIQPVEFWLANMMGGCECSVVKYTTRWRNKGGIEDLRKVRHFLLLIREDPAYIRRLSAERRRSYGGATWRDQITAEKYIDANRLGVEEGGIIRHITAFSLSGAIGELDSAIAWAEELIARELGGGK
jgi:hypothetical protein